MRYAFLYALIKLISNNKEDEKTILAILCVIILGILFGILYISYYLIQKNLTRKIQSKQISISIYIQLRVIQETLNHI
jgi:cell division protein FtsX